MTKERLSSNQYTFFSDTAQEPKVDCNRVNVIDDDQSLSALQDWCLLIRDRRWSARQKRELVQHFSSVADIFNANSETTARVIQTKQKRANPEISIEQIKRDMHWLSMSGNHLISIQDSRYPSLLRQLPDPPLALFGSGNIDLLNEPKVAIVGSRRPTPVGQKIVGQLSNDLADLGVVITSGMALGIDGLAHQAALAVGGGTIAVMGCGLDVVYPARNASLHQAIAARGLLLSEFPLGVAPTKYTFPMRNRIVSGLAYGVIIVEAANKSGTLITARFASEQNREVMVVPGSALSSQYQGSHDLIRSGAALVSCSADVLHCLAAPLRDLLKKYAQLSSPHQNVAEKHALLRFIGAEATSVDAIISSSGLTTAEVSSILLELELKGLVAVSREGGYVNLS